MTHHLHPISCETKASPICVSSPLFIPILLNKIFSIKEGKVECQGINNKSKLTMANMKKMNQTSSLFLHLSLRLRKEGEDLDFH
jgi:hypothetical protein